MLKNDGPPLGWKFSGLCGFEAISPGQSQWATTTQSMVAIAQGNTHVASLQNLYTFK